MSSVEVSFLISAVAFVVLVVFVIILIMRTVQMLKKVEKILNNFETISTDLNKKMECVHPIFRMLSNVGEGLEYKTAAFKSKAFYENLLACVSQEKKKEDVAGDIIDLAIIGARLFKNLKAKE